MDPIKELKKVAQETKETEEIDDRVTDEINDVIDELEDLEETAVDNVDDVIDELEDVVESTDKESKKKAALINPGDRIVCLNPVQGLFKGRIYTAGEYAEPNFLVVKDDDGNDVGIFRADRFNIYWDED